MRVLPEKGQRFRARRWKPLPYRHRLYLRYTARRPGRTRSQYGLAALLVASVRGTRASFSPRIVAGSSKTAASVTFSTRPAVVRR